MRGRVILAVLAVFSASPGLAATPTETVRAFYDLPGFDLSPQARGRFIDPALKILNANDAIKATGEGGCIDPGLALDSPDADPAEVTASLKLAESVNGTEAKVIAAFMVAKAPHRMEWKLRQVDGEWKVYDLLSVTGEWALSQYGCE